MTMDVRRVLKSVIVDARKMFRMFRSLDREAIAAHVLSGNGIEIGGLHNPLRVPSGVRVRYVDRMSVEDLRTQYPELAVKVLTRVDIVDDGEKLLTLPDASEDFIIANHFLEHCEDPLSTLLAHQRVVRPGGILFLCVPDKRFTFDMPRQLTTYEHILRDLREGPIWSRREHVADWVRHVEHNTDVREAERRVDQLLAEAYSIHYHVWTFETLMDMMLRARLDAGLTVDLESVLLTDGEIIMVLRRRAA
jgi:predicted SAM-dependent methyltransferase